MTVREVHDPLALRQLAARLVRRLPRAYQDNVAPCAYRCLFCSACSKTYNFTVDVFQHDDTIVYEVFNQGEPCGIIYFTGSMLHGCFFDGRLFGKGEAITEAVRRFGLGDGRPVTAQVPHNSRAVAEWLKKVGFRFSRKKRRDFLYNGKLLDVEVLEWDS